MIEKSEELKRSDVGVKLLHYTLSSVAPCPVWMAVSAFVCCELAVCWQICLGELYTFLRCQLYYIFPEIYVIIMLLWITQGYKLFTFNWNMFLALWFFVTYMYHRPGLTLVQRMVCWLFSVKPLPEQLLLLISMRWHRKAIFESKGDKLSSSAECRIRTQRLSGTESPADWMPADKPTELSRIKLNTWTQQPVPMISEHSAHSTPLPVGIRTWLWWYTCLLLLISMLWHRQATFELMTYSNTNDYEYHCELNLCLSR